VEVHNGYRRKTKSSLGNESKLKNADKDKVTKIKTSSLRKNDKPVTADGAEATSTNE